MNTQLTRMFEEQFKAAGALWNYPGLGAHVVLHSGRHSDFFCDGGKIVSDSVLLDKACDFLAHSVLWQFLKHIESFRDRVIWVVGPAMGAIKIADGVARHLSYKTWAKIKSSYTEKGDDGRQIFNKADAPQRGDICLVVEDTLTTGDSSNMCAEQIIARGAVVLPIRLALVNRSGNDVLPNGDSIVSVLSYSPNSWSPDDCPLCKRHSEAIKEPKKQENWARLVSSGFFYGSDCE